jgi:hypothetical protein
VHTMPNAFEPSSGLLIGSFCHPSIGWSGLRLRGWQVINYHGQPER